MKFYNRQHELQILGKIEAISRQSSRMTVIIGRRRIGKTRLIRQYFQEEKYLYFFVARKAETLLCEEFLLHIKEVLGVAPFGEITSFRTLFAYLLDLAKNQHFTLVIDEFQEFQRINPAIYSDMQNLWDQQKEDTRLNLIVSGSIFSLMKRLFENAKEPLFGRANERLHIKPFTVSTIKEILQDYYPYHTPRDLLDFYIFTGGVPKYIENLVDNQSFTFDNILNEILKEGSIFLEEGKNVLIEEFGSNYTIYFSILSLIASSKTSRSEIESILKRNIGGYLDQLENEYSIIKKVKPILARPNSRTQKYFIEDNFLNFWFRFIYKNKGAVEIGNFDFVRRIIERDYSTFAGHFLEKYFHAQLAESKKYSLIGNYWEKGTQNEIDIVAINELDKKVLIGEVKLNAKRISLGKLEMKAANLIKQLKGYEIEYKAFSIDDM